MIVHALVTSFASFLFLQPSEPLHLIPVDAGTEDRGALSDSFRVQQADFREDRAFEKLYKVAGSKDVYVRKAGGLSALFHSSEYIQTPQGEVPIVPAGTVYYIGEVPPELISQLSSLQEPAVIPKTLVQPEDAVPRANPSTPKPRTLKQTIPFLDDEAYRRKRLTSFVLEIVLNP
jgi:hypothetical protein